MPRGDVYVPGRGPLNAKVVVLAESLGSEEVKQGRILVGPSGQKLMEWIEAAGLSPENIRFENVYPYYPRGGSIRNVSLADLKPWQDDALVRMDACREAVVYVPLGNLALATLTGRPTLAPGKGGRGPWQTKGAGITAWRGSIMSFYRQSTDSYVKCIPTIHPAAILYQKAKVARAKAGSDQGGSPGWEGRCRADWKRIAEDSEFEDFDLPDRKLDTDPPQDVVENFILNLSIFANQMVAIDIETIPDQRKITCISFASSTDYAISIPWNKKNYEYIKMLCELSNPKVLQNGFYDAYYLAGEGIVLRNYVYDTRALNHYLDQTDSGSLGYMASIWTRESYYKPDDESKEKFWTGATWLELLEYNAKDAAVTWEVANKQLSTMNAKQLDKYHEWYSSMFEPLMAIMQHGVRMDLEACEKAYEEASRRALEARDRACELAGRPLFKLKTQGERLLYTQSLGEPMNEEELEKALRRGKRTPEQILADIGALGISDQELGVELLKHSVPIPKSDKNKTGETLDEVSVRRLRQRYATSKPKVVALLDEVLEFREQKKLSEFYQAKDIDSDGRMRCEYSYVTRTNRLASKSNPYKTGRNLQNIHRSARHVYLPDERCVFVKCDSSRIENRLVDLMCYQVSGNERLLWQARALPHEYDGYREVASWIFDVAPEEVTSEQRHLGKAMLLARGYGTGPQRFVNELSKEGVMLELKEAKRWFGVMDEKNPELERWQVSIRAQLLAMRSLVNSWGRRIRWWYDRMGDDLYREAYAWKPQSDNAMLNSQWGVKRLYHEIKCQRWKSRINLLVHDEVVTSCPPDEAWSVAKFVSENLGAERDWYGIKMAVPVGVTIGRTWAGDVEWKVLPEREEFEHELSRLV